MRYALLISCWVSIISTRELPGLIMRFILATLLLVLCCVFSALGAAKLETLIKTCSRKDPKLNECAVKAANLLLPKISAGRRDLGIMEFDPLKTPFLDYSHGDFKFNQTEVEHRGLGAMIVKQIRIDLAKNKWEIKGLIPRYYMTGICQFGGTVLNHPISGAGPCNLTSINHDHTMVLSLSKVKKNGKEHLRVNSVKTTLRFTKGIISLEGLFDGDKGKEAELNKFLNKNAVKFLNVFNSELETSGSEVFKYFFQSLFDQVPYDEILTP